MSHSVRKIVKVGCSTAVVIPPHVLGHIGAERGDYMVFDITIKNFAIISLAPIPPYSHIAEQEEGIDNPQLLSSPPGDASPNPQLKAAPRRAEDCHQHSDSLSDARSDSGSPPVSTSNKTDSTVQAPLGDESNSPSKPRSRAVDRVISRQDNLPVSHALKPGRPSRID